MRKGERPFSATKFARLSVGRAAERMLALGYCQVSRRFGHVARVDVSDNVMVQYFIRENFGRADSGVLSCSYPFTPNTL